MPRFGASDRPLEPGSVTNGGGGWTAAVPSSSISIRGWRAASVAAAAGGGEKARRSEGDDGNQCPAPLRPNGPRSGKATGQLPSMAMRLALGPTSRARADGSIEAPWSSLAILAKRFGLQMTLAIGRGLTRLQP